MAENKKSFIAYIDWKSTFDLLTDEEAGKLIKHIFSYVSDENPTLEDRLLNLSFSHIEQDLKRDLKKWESYIDKQKNNGKKGGRPKTQKTQAFSEKPKKADNVNVNDNVNDNEILSFDEFWEKYDKKVDKVKCKKKFDKLTEKELTKINETLTYYINSKPDKKYRKNPLTYLNGKCWEDEIEKPKAKSQTYKYNNYTQ